jgi:hypothetical protein
MNMWGREALPAEKTLTLANVSRHSLAGVVALVLIGTGRVEAQCLRWDDAFYNGPGGVLDVLCSFDSGNGPELYVGGDFGSITGGGPYAYYIAKWNGTSWSPVGGGTNESVLALHVHDNGSGPALYVGGAFGMAGGVTATYVARWDGNSYSPLGSGLYGFQNGGVAALATFDDGTGPALYAGGFFASPGGGLNIAKWNGTSWSGLGSGTNYGGIVWALGVFDDGTGPALYAGGEFTTAGGIAANHIARWNGSNWAQVGGGAPTPVYSFAAFNDGTGSALFVGGIQFSITGGGSSVGIVKWDGTSFSAVGGGTNGQVYGLCVFDDGSGPALYAAGNFLQAGTIAANRVAKWNGTQWSALGSGLANYPARAVTVYDDGSAQGPSLFVAGDFGQAGGLRSWHIAQWHATCANPIDTFCFGDGSVASCPCLNTGLPGHGCENSVGTGGARLYATSLPGPDAVVLHATGELPTALTIFLQGSTLIYNPVFFGDGLRCAGGSLKRLYVKIAAVGQVSAPARGDPSVTARSAALGDPIAPGSTRYYQTYYRDPNPSFCPVPPEALGDTFNSSNGVRIVW